MRIQHARVWRRSPSSHPHPDEVTAAASAGQSVYQGMFVLHMLQPYPVIYEIANPVRDLLDRKISKEHVQSSDESIKTKTAKTT